MDTFDIEKVNNLLVKNILPKHPMVMVGMGTCGIGNGADKLYAAFKEKTESFHTHFTVKKTGCFGFCAQEPLVMAYVPGNSLLVYSCVDIEDIEGIVQYLVSNKFYERHAFCQINAWDHITEKITYGKSNFNLPHWNETSFFKGQKKIVLRNAGFIDPENIDDYLAIGGYKALAKALISMDAKEVIDEVINARLRGRGGAGFPTGTKWAIMSRAVSDKKYVICNADEGDPGAYMNRNEIESDPHMLIEGMLIGAFAMGANEGIAYVRAEYPLAVKRLKNAILQAEELGLLGEKILGTNFNFKLHVVEGAGAFVCGEETALIASIEGKAGRPMPRPPYPAGKGLFGKPTNINNVETWCNVPVIIHKGSKWFTSTGTEKSPGTKVFSLVGKVKNTGLVELPLGSTIEQFVFHIGEGTGTRKRVKAVQTGGPSGGCIPVSHFNAQVDYESLAELGAIMGSGGMVVMDHDNCMVDVARYFVNFSASESCGKCTPCREGLAQAQAILTRIANGNARLKDIETLELLSRTIKDTAICGLGQTAPNPILTTLKYFRDEYEQHILEKRCKSGVCEHLFMALCENSCPMHMNIPGYIELIKENRLEDAFELTLRYNPLPGTIGRICHFHCQMRCRREMLDEAVSQGEIHRYLADTMYKMGKENEIYDKLIKEKLTNSGKQIAIVGAGPAGLTAAFYLLRLGHSVTIYDSLPEAGGVARFGIPHYRLPRQVLRKEIELIKKLGAHFIFNTTIGKDITLNDLQEKYHAVYIAIGAWKDMNLAIAGENYKGVYQGIEFLKELASDTPPEIGRKVVIIGAGNVAIDAARSLWRLGKDVTVVYRREKVDMPANADEILEAGNEGITFRFLESPEEILADASGNVRALKVAKLIPGNVDTSGRRRPVLTGEYEEIECQSIIVAIGEMVNSSELANNEMTLRKDGRIVINPFTCETSLEKVFAGGDAVTGPSTASEAMGMARKAAEQIDYYLMREKRFDKLFRKFDYSSVIDPEPKGNKRIVPEKLRVADRKGNFLEVASGLSGEQARLEAIRCLRCDIKC